ncbi:TPA: transposase, partial [Mannheimia haemolytica]|nr:transposase [Mannheimia haemolytica]HDL1933656.1 transposase [Mannheimia haemolytica]HDL3421779.1 transposase [Mannheimia haemolytica]
MRKAQRKTIRLKYYDYAQNGLYFVTICVQGRLSLFGGVLDNAMYLNDAGKMVEKQYKELENYFNNV